MPYSRSLILTIAAIVLQAPSASAATCKREFTFDTDPKLGIFEIKRLSGPEIQGDDLRAADGARLVVLPFDQEDHPVVGRSRAVALIYVTRGDLGEEAVGGELLQARSSPPIDFDQATIKKAADGLRLSIPTARGCRSYVIDLDGHGALTVQGRRVGRLR